MLPNTGSLVFGLMLGVAQLTNAATDTSVAITSPIYPTATDSIPPSASTTADTKPAPTDECLAKCEKARNECQTAPNANQATCASEFSSCVGYVPYDKKGNFVPPTACSSGKPSASSTTDMKPAPTDACLAKCEKARDECQTAPDANQSTCASEFSTCVGYVPYDKEGNFVPPTACASGKGSATATTDTKPAPTDACLEKCQKARNECSYAPNANQATCAAEFADCVGYVPYDKEGNFVPPTACSTGSTLASSTMKATEPAKSGETKPTEPAVVVSGAGHVTSGKVVGLLSAVD
ncbi:hypothetical protein ACLX1H_000192 [Fusarium chlamydosporum]